MKVYSLSKIQLHLFQLDSNVVILILVLQMGEHVQCGC